MGNRAPQTRGDIREISRSGELITELRQVVFRKRRWLDSLLPLLAFILLNAISDVGMALIGSSGIAIVIGAYRLVRRQPWSYALGGVGWVVLAGMIVRFVGGRKAFSYREYYLAQALLCCAWLVYALSVHWWHGSAT
jgi:hypothetical protein